MAGRNEAFRICGSVSEALSYMPCPLQYTEPNTKNDLWVFWSQHNNEFPSVFPSTADTTIYHDTIKEKIASALKNAYISDNFGCWLVQFWAPVTTKDQFFLTTCDLPFGLTKLHEGLCFYRSECLKFRISIVTENENQLGPTGRVFKHGLPEMSPDISRYSAADFPQHSSAFTAGLGNYLAVPVFVPLSNECAGVLEIIGDKKGSFSQDLVQMVYEMLKKVDLRSSNMYGHPDKKQGIKGLARALKEIEEQLSFICRTHQLPLAQTWLPILDRSNVERFTTTEEQFCICTSAGYEFRAACDMFHLGKSQGVVGKAFLTRSSCFCSDITQLSMTEYPLAHVAHRVGLHSSFAICLQSSYTGDYVYLLEFFLPQDNKSDCRSPQTILNMLLASMERQFRSFKLASGQKLGEKLSVEIIPVPSDDGLNSFEICHSVKPLSDIEAVAIQWFNPLNRLLKSGNTVNIYPENIDLTTSSRTSNSTTNLTNVRVLTNRVVSNNSEEESMMKISEGHHRINSVVLQQSVGAKVNGTETTLASQSPNSLGTKHLEINDMNYSSDQLESPKVADSHCEESSGGDQLCHDNTTSLTHAAKPTTQAAGVQNESIIPRKCPNFLLSGVHADELERLAKVSKLYYREELQSSCEGVQAYEVFDVSSEEDATRMRKPVVPRAIVKGDHPFKTSITEEIPVSIIDEFSKFVQTKSIRTRRNKVCEKKDDILEEQFDLGIASIAERTWFFELHYAGIGINDMHIDVIFYYLRKKAKYGNIRMTTTDNYFSSIIEEVYNKSIKDSMNAKNQIFDMIKKLREYVLGFYILCNTPWVFVDYVLMPINVKYAWHWVLGVLSLHDCCIYIYDSMRSPGHDVVIHKALHSFAVMIPLLLNTTTFYQQRSDIATNISHYLGKKDLSEPFALTSVDNLPQQEKTDCGIYCSAFAEYFIEGKKIPVDKNIFDPTRLRTRYGALLYYYGKKKQLEYLVSEDEATGRLDKPCVSKRRNTKTN
nr:PREDICTED: uncharacterized protein LOC107777439 [Nicotiana tabacum]